MPCREKEQSSFFETRDRVSEDAVWLLRPAVESSGIEARLLAHDALQSLVAAMDVDGMDLGSWVLVHPGVGDLQTCEERLGSRIFVCAGVMMVEVEARSLNELVVT